MPAVTSLCLHGSVPIVSMCAYKRGRGLTPVQVHTQEYVEAFTGGALDEARVKRIGFGGDVTRSPVLINRTLAEVAGAPFSYRTHVPYSFRTCEDLGMQNADLTLLTQSFGFSAAHVPG